MPRIHPRDIWQARNTNKALLALLPVCRDLQGARNELRWLKQHAVAVSQQIGHSRQPSLLTEFIDRRARGEPLQYVLGSEYFGELEIRCRPGVLIPRPETAASTSHLAHIVSTEWGSIAAEKKPLRVLDLCTGSGCIPLLFHHEFYSHEQNNSKQLEMVGVDISSDALSLARENLIHQIARQGKQYSSGLPRTKSLQHIGFVQADILKDDQDMPPDDRYDGPLPLAQALARLSDSSPPTFDILTCNPPYISPRSFVTTTARSVRQYEPVQALVPAPQNTKLMTDNDIGDLFYPKLLAIAEQIEAKVILFEVADLTQAQRVAAMAARQGTWARVEIWRDEPTAEVVSESVQIDRHNIAMRGAGHGRSVVAYRDKLVTEVA
ncbi:Release factor glutamine methyltransferase [Cercospora beticola]|uniref:Release factor glutamine methyltransferase n=1 Tax=Cercospora beticola TaxID=122368 RepID=A0A2G5I360_CERBT|nr:Release factor glutamine methyltransferase [Cercospora beticola]PIA98933.1 Release factor glutamine methyltransferase [Cercospora beticola]WPB00585.1 hypothetical protein RHO25_005205 [Cercospora beticola]CAK1361197.1 unnamed protein product [Cercospora beticola]